MQIPPVDRLLAEEARQLELWGEQNHPNGTGGIVYEGQAHYYRKRCDDRHNSGCGTWADILLEEIYEALAESDPEKLVTELEQCGAVILSWLKAIDRARECAPTCSPHLMQYCSPECEANA